MGSGWGGGGGGGRGSSSSKRLDPASSGAAVSHPGWQVCSDRPAPPGEGARRPPRSPGLRGAAPAAALSSPRRPPGEASASKGCPSRGEAGGSRWGLCCAASRAPRPAGGQVTRTTPGFRRHAAPVWISLSVTAAICSPVPGLGILCGNVTPRPSGT